MTEIAKKQISNGPKTLLKTKVDLSKYKIVYVCTLVWWSKMCVPVKNFLSENDFSDKTIFPFIIHGGSGNVKLLAIYKNLLQKQKLKRFLRYIEKEIQRRMKN